MGAAVAVCVGVGDMAQHIEYSEQLGYWTLNCTDPSVPDSQCTLSRSPR